MVDLRRHLGHSAHDKAVETSRKLARHAAFPSLPLDHPEYGPTEKRADGRRACDGEEDEEEEDEDEDEEEEKEVTVSTSTRLGEV